MERYIHKEAKVGSRIVRMIPDENVESPRTSMDNLGTMICFHNRYNLGDKHDYDHNDYNSYAEMGEAIQKNEDVAVILPLYLYDHSGITMSTGRFSCPWDSGQVGFIYISKKKAREEYGRLTKKTIEKITKYLEGEVETYDQYLRGDVYGFEVVEVKECSEGHEHEEDVDSCGGFYGDDVKENGMADHLDKELAEALAEA